MAVTPKRKTKPAGEETRWPFGPRNYIIFALAIAVIAIGYITLGYGSMTLAPILLVLGYCVFIPIALLVRGHRESSQPTAKPSEPSTNH